MAAIIEPRRLPTLPPQRPALRLVPAPVPAAGRARPAAVARPIEVAGDLGLSTAHLVAAVVGLVLVLLLGLALGNGAASGPSAASAASAGRPAATASPGATTVTVRSGDTYWSIARRIQPSGDVRALVDRLQALNGGAVLQPGDEVVLPGQ